MAVPVPVSRELFTVDADGDPHLLGARCLGCGEPHFPAAPVCPYCSSDDVEAIELSRSGTLWAWTAVNTAPPGYEGDVPFGFGVVELPEGLRLVTRITESDPGVLAFGQPVALGLVVVGTDDEGSDVVTYAFGPGVADGSDGAR